MKNIKSKIKTSLFIICFAFAGGISGNIVAPSNAEALHPCQNDECEDGWLGDYCQDNPGGGTYCNFVGDDCLTRACGHDGGQEDPRLSEY